MSQEGAPGAGCPLTSFRATLNSIPSRDSELAAWMPRSLLLLLYVNLSSFWGLWDFGEKGLTGTEPRIDRPVKGVGCHANGLKLDPLGWNLQADAMR